MTAPKLTKTRLSHCSAWPLPLRRSGGDQPHRLCFPERIRRLCSVYSRAPACTMLRRLFRSQGIRVQFLRVTAAHLFQAELQSFPAFPSFDMSEFCRKTPPLSSWTWLSASLAHSPSNKLAFGISSYHEGRLTFFDTRVRFAEAVTDKKRYEWDIPTYIHTYIHTYIPTYMGGAQWAKSDVVTRASPHAR